MSCHCVVLSTPRLVNQGLAKQLTNLQSRIARPCQRSRTSDYHCLQGVKLSVRNYKALGSLSFTKSTMNTIQNLNFSRNQLYSSLPGNMAFYSTSNLICRHTTLSQDTFIRRHTMSTLTLFQLINKYSNPLHFLYLLVGCLESTSVWGYLKEYLVQPVLNVQCTRFSQRIF